MNEPLRCSGRALPGQKGPAPGRWGALMGGKMDGLDCCQQAEKLNTGLCTQLVWVWSYRDKEEASILQQTGLD